VVQGFQLPSSPAPTEEKFEVTPHIIVDVKRLQVVSLACQNVQISALKL